MRREGLGSRVKGQGSPRFARGFAHFVRYARGKAQEIKRGKIFVISAPSGCGKTTLLKKLLKEKALKLAHSISMTSRPQRTDEKNGVDYYFVSKKAFEEKVENGELLEWEENFGHLYGTPREFVENAMRTGKNVLLSIDVKGAMNIRKAYPERSTLIFILPPSFKELEKRLRKRKTDESYVISNRLKIARDEMAYSSHYDHTVVNDNLGLAYKKLRAVIRSDMA
jgi:guanylate kinase